MPSTYLTGEFIPVEHEESYLRLDATTMRTRDESVDLLVLLLGDLEFLLVTSYFLMTFNAPKYRITPFVSN